MLYFTSSWLVSVGWYLKLFLDINVRILVVNHSQLWTLTNSSRKIEKVPFHILIRVPIHTYTIVIGTISPSQTKSMSSKREKKSPKSKKRVGQGTGQTKHMSTWGFSLILSSASVMLLHPASNHFFCRISFSALGSLFTKPLHSSLLTLLHFYRLGRSRQGWSGLCALACGLRRSFSWSPSPPTHTGSPSSIHHAH